MLQTAIILSAEGCHTLPDHSAELFAEDGPKGSKGTLRHDFQANTRATIFFISQCHHKIQEDSCKEIQVWLAEDNFELVMSEHC